MSPRAAARLASALFVVSGLVTLASPLLPAPPGLNHWGVAAIGLIAIAGGGLIPLVPWDRLHPKATLGLMLPAFTLIGIHNHFGGIDPYRYGLFFLVAFAWIGMAHARWTSLLVLPPFAVSYLTPLFFADVPSWAWSSLFYTAAVGVMVAESLAVITQGRNRAEEALLVSERRFRSLVQKATDLITVMDRSGTIVYESPAVGRVLGFDTDERVGSGALDGVHEADRDRVRRAIENLFEHPGRSTSVELRVRRKDGSWRWLEATITNLLDDGGVDGLVVNARDVTERRAVQDQLSHLAYHDTVTGLPNRTYFLDRTAAALNRARRHRTGVGVLFLDLDGFKVINDSLGHEAGDQLLSQVAGRLATAVRPTDTVARLGGDEFTVLLEDLTDGVDAVRTAERMLRALQEPLEVHGHRLVTSGSIGIAVDLDGSAGAGEMLRHADLAMYMAKERGRGRYEVFDPAMGDRAHARLELEHDLRLAIGTGQLVAHYQPEVCLLTGRVLAQEALARWAHPTRELVEPAAFLPLAEETGIIVAVGRDILFQACAEASRWRGTDGEPAPGVSVNVSARQLRGDSLVRDVESALVANALDPARLTLEVAEGALIDGTAVAGRLRGLRMLGVRLCIDDFGKGYASLAQLTDLPFGSVKLDRSFVTGLGRSEASTPVIAGVVTLAHALGMTVTAEGVETAEQLAAVRDLGCDRAQGYLLGAPRPATAFDAPPVRTTVAD